MYTTVLEVRGQTPLLYTTIPIWLSQILVNTINLFLLLLLGTYPWNFINNYCRKMQVETALNQQLYVTTQIPSSIVTFLRQIINWNKSRHCLPVWLPQSCTSNAIVVFSFSVRRLLWTKSPSASLHPKCSYLASLIKCQLISNFLP